MTPDVVTSSCDVVSSSPRVVVGDGVTTTVDVDTDGVCPNVVETVVGATVLKVVSVGTFVVSIVVSGPVVSSGVSVDLVVGVAVIVGDVGAAVE